MGLIKRLAARAIQELARNPEARAKLPQGVKVTSQKFNEEVNPRAKRAWQEAQPELKRTRSRIGVFMEEVRDEYRKGRRGE